MKTLLTIFEESFGHESSTVYFREYSKSDYENEKNDKINHFHIHLIPRKGGEFEVKTEIYKLLRRHDHKLIDYSKIKIIENKNDLKKNQTNFKIA